MVTVEAYKMHTDSKAKVDSKTSKQIYEEVISPGQARTEHRRNAAEDIGSVSEVARKRVQEREERRIPRKEEYGTRACLTCYQGDP